MSAPAAPAQEAQAQSSALTAPLFYQILLGELSFRAEQATAGYSLTLDAARKTQDSRLFQRAVHMALQTRSAEAALQAAQAWSAAQPDSRPANQFVWQILLSQNRIAATLEPLKRHILLTAEPDRMTLVWALPGAYERASDKRLAASVVETALTPSLKSPLLGPTAWASIGILWSKAADTARALKAAEQGLSLDLRAEHPALLALSLMDSQDPAAERLVKMHLPQARPEFRMSYVRILLASQRHAEARDQLQWLQQHAPDFPDSWLVAGAMDLQALNLGTSQQHLQRYLALTDARQDTAERPEVQRGRAQAFFSLANIAERQNDWQAADGWLQKIQTEDDVLRAQLRRGHLLAQQGRLDEGLQLIQEQPERSDEDAKLKQAAQVQMLRNHHQWDRARALLLSQLAASPQDTDLIYDLAMLNEKMGDLAEMERLLRQLIAAKPDDPHAYNALGYSLADHNLRLDEAIQLVGKALELAPKDPFITDSMAWALYRKGDHAQALRLLQQAYADKPDAEIAAHLGEVLWVSGRQQEALRVFTEGKRLNPDNDTLLETLKRLRIDL